jgi:hypothetical protein
MVQTRSTNQTSTQQAKNASYKHFDTPKKARIRQEVQAVEYYGIKGGNSTKTAIFKRHGVSKMRGYTILAEHLEIDRTAHSRGETRDTKHKLSPKDLRHIKDLLNNADFQEL